MSNGLMNMMFRATSRYDRMWHNFYTAKFLSNVGAQEQMYQELHQKE